MTASIFSELSREDLIALIIKQGELINALRAEIEKLKEDNERMRKKIEELEREKHRQAAPFRIPEAKKKAEPKKPGGQLGHPGHYRTIDEEEIEEVIEVPIKECPHCKGKLRNIERVEQIIEELPVIRKRVYKVITQVGFCEKCKEFHSSVHPLQTSTASGAAKVQLGPQAKALAMSLQFEYGLTKRKTCRLMEQKFNIELTPGGLVYATHKAGNKMEPQYQEIITQLQVSEVIHSDETSWYVGSPKYWLWVFTNKNATAYQVSNSRGRDVITSMIGENYSGTLVSDCLVIYDNITSSQHKCYSHHLKAISQAIEKADDEQIIYLNKLKLLLQTALAVKEVKADKPPDEYKRLCNCLEQQADELILPERKGLEEKVANRLRKQRKHLFTFLYKDEVDATNNLAERQLRPAVIARKVSCGNKTEKGAYTFQVLSSIATTANQHNQSFSDLTARSIRLATA